MKVYSVGYNILWERVAINRMYHLGLRGCFLIATYIYNGFGLVEATKGLSV